MGGGTPVELVEAMVTKAEMVSLEVLMPELSRALASSGILGLSYPYCSRLSRVLLIPALLRQPYSLMGNCL
jgi:hypothetical protein